MDESTYERVQRVVVTAFQILLLSGGLSLVALLWRAVFAVEFT